MWVLTGNISQEDSVITYFMVQDICHRIGEIQRALA